MRKKEEEEEAAKRKEAEEEQEVCVRERGSKTFSLGCRGSSSENSSMQVRQAERLLAAAEAQVRTLTFRGPKRHPT